MILLPLTSVDYNSVNLLTDVIDTLTVNQTLELYGDVKLIQNDVTALREKNNTFPNNRRKSTIVSIPSRILKQIWDISVTRTNAVLHYLATGSIKSGTTIVIPLYLAPTDMYAFGLPDVVNKGEIVRFSVKGAVTGTVGLLIKDDLGGTLSSLSISINSSGDGSQTYTVLGTYTGAYITATLTQTIVTAAEYGGSSDIIHSEIHKILTT